MSTNYHIPSDDQQSLDAAKALKDLGHNKILAALADSYDSFAEAFMKCRAKTEAEQCRSHAAIIRALIPEYAPATLHVEVI